MATIFTRIMNGEIPGYKIIENDKFCAFLDVKPLKRGHTLVVPKQEIDYIFDMDDTDLGEMMVFAKQVAKKIHKIMKSKKVAIVVIGLEVPHAHIHLIPLDEESDVDFKRKRLDLTKEEFEEIAKSISRN